MQFEYRGVLPELGLLPSYQLVGLAAFLLQLHDFTVSLNHTFSQLGAQCSELFHIFTHLIDVGAVGLLR